MGRVYDNYVRSYCLDRERDREFFALIEDLYDTEEVQGLQQYPQHSSINRLDHITSVTYTAYCWAKKAGLDVRATARGATSAFRASTGSAATATTGLCTAGANPTPLATWC